MPRGLHFHDWATLAPIVCAVHCAVTPLALALLPAFSVSTEFEGVLLLVSLLLAVVVVRSGFQLHGDTRVWVPLAVGGAVWVLSLAGAFAPLPESLTSPAGSITIAGGLYWSGRIRPCRVCARAEAAISEVHG